MLISVLVIFAINQKGCKIIRRGLIIRVCPASAGNMERQRWVCLFFVTSVFIVVKLSTQLIIVFALKAGWALLLQLKHLLWLMLHTKREV